MAKITKHKFDFGKKSLKNLICSCIYFAALIAYIVIMAVYQGQFMGISLEKKGPEINIGITVGMGLCSIIALVLGIMLLVFDINLARYARSSKTFSNPMISVMTFALIPAICVAMSIVEYYILASQMITMVTGIFEILGRGGEVDPTAEIEALMQASYSTISYFSIISSSVMAGVVAWQIALDSLNYHVNK